MEDDSDGEDSNYAEDDNDGEDWSMVWATAIGTDYNINGNSPTIVGASQEERM